MENIKYQTLNGRSRANAFIRRIPLIGSVVKIQRPEAIPPEKELDKLAKRHRALFIKIEPHNQILNTKYQPDNWPLLPSKTLLLDLTKSEEKLWENLDQDAKYSIRKAKKQLSVTSYQLSVTDNAGEKQGRLRQFYELLKSTGGSKHFYTPKWQNLKLKAECFGKKAWLVLATERNNPRSSTTHCTPLARAFLNFAQSRKVRHHSHKNESFPLAGCLLLTHDNVAYYHHAANSPKGRKLLAGYLVLWEAIKLAKSLNCHTFDFEGTYDERFPKQFGISKGIYWKVKVNVSC